MSNATETTTPTAVAPCPAWCELTPHDFGDEGVGIRHHNAQLTTFWRRADGEPPESFPIWWLDLMETELRKKSGGRTKTERPLIAMTCEKGTCFDSNDARDLATRLLAAADKLDQINGSK